MTLGCGLNAWYRNSAIIHATSASPLGPFDRKEQVIGSFTHEPIVLTLPNREGFVLFKIGCADNATTGSNGTYPEGRKKLLGRCMGCTNGVTDGSVFCPHPDQVYERACQDALFSKSLDGPWLRQNLSGFGYPEWPWKDVNLGLESHAPILLANRSLLTFTRGAFAPHPIPTCAIWTVVSEGGWNGTYSVVGNTTTFPMSLEDTYMFQDPRGNFHALFHSFVKGAVGGHAFSRDGSSWTFASKANGFLQDGAYSRVVTLANGTRLTLDRRERPHLLLDAAGNPAYLTNGVSLTQFNRTWANLADWTYTAVFAIGA
jgi:hypothetical protein